MWIVLIAALALWYFGFYHPNQLREEKERKARELQRKEQEEIELRLQKEAFLRKKREEQLQRDLIIKQEETQKLLQKYKTEIINNPIFPAILMYIIAYIDKEIQKTPGTALGTEDLDKVWIKICKDSIYVDKVPSKKGDFHFVPLRKFGADILQYEQGIALCMGLHDSLKAHYTALKERIDFSYTIPYHLGNRWKIEKDILCEDTYYENILKEWNERTISCKIFIDLKRLHPMLTKW